MAQGDSDNSPINVTHVLKGIDFPASRDDLLAHARKNHADKHVLEEIGNMPEQDYTTMADVMKGFGQSH